jgi:hypothetical protein
VSRVPEVHPSASHPGLAVARHSRWEDGIKEVNSAQYRFQQINWGSEPHQVAHAVIALKCRDRCLNRRVALLWCLVTSEAAKVNSLKRERTDVGRRLSAQFRINAPLRNAEERLLLQRVRTK